MTWAAAARSRSKLEELRTSFGAKAAAVPLIVADAAYEASLRELCASTRVVVSTVGPYALYGEPLLKACAESGTDYCDLSGEVQWIRRMMQRYEAAAQKSGARLVHCCGFDSIPSDMGVHFLQRQAGLNLGAPCVRVKMRVKAMRGGFSGGTVASLMNVIKEAAADPLLRAADTHQGHGRPRPRLRLDRQDAGSGRRVPRTRHRQGAVPGGFWTPSRVFGDGLIRRLTARSGLTFELCIA